MQGICTLFARLQFYDPGITVLRWVVVMGSLSRDEGFGVVIGAVAALGLDSGQS